MCEEAIAQWAIEISGAGYFWGKEITVAGFRYLATGFRGVPPVQLMCQLS